MSAKESSSRATRGFHAYKSVAPLKHLGVSKRVTTQARRFHAYKSVAPLKQGDLRAIACCYRPFPRLQKRGPIEATSWTRMSLRKQSFHAYKSVAPLKLSALLTVTHALCDCFHAYKSVAPLKRPAPRSRSGAGQVSTLTKAWPH